MVRLPRGLLRGFSSLRIGTKIFLAFILVIVAVVLLISTVLMNIWKTTIETNAEEFSRELVRQAAAIADWRAKEFEKFAFITTDDGAFKRRLREFDAARGTERVVAANGLLAGANRQAALDVFLRSFVVVSPSGNLLSYDKRKELFHMERLPSEDYPDLSALYAGMRKTGEKTVWNGFDAEGARVFFARRILDSDTFEDLGLFAAEIDAAYFDLALQDDSPLREGTLLIADADGAVLLVNGNGDLAGKTREKIAAALSAAGDSEVYSASDEESMVFASVTKAKGWKVVSVLPVEYLLRHAGSSRLAIVLVSAAALFLAVLLVIGLTSGITKNIKALERSMRTIEKGDFNIRITPHSLDEVGLLGLRFNLMADKIEELIRTVYEERLAKQEMEFKALQAQINPHFLYNTLGSIKWLARKNGQETLETMVSALIELLRFSVSASKFTTVREEVRYVSNYLVLQKLRYEDRFSFSFEVDEAAADLRMLRFVLQPLAENALFHGLELSKGRGTIVIRAGRNDESLVLEVEDNGVGIKEEEIAKLLAEQKKEYPGFNSIGLKNISDRIKLNFGEAFGLAFSKRPGGGTRVEVRLPIFTEAAEPTAAGTNA